MIRSAAVERSISEIMEDDDYISVVGTVVSNDPREYTLLLDDGTGQVIAFVERLFDIGKVVRVIGRPFENGKGINVDIIQDFSSVNISLYNDLRKWEAMR
ncbi:MAG TPA: replication protein RepA [Candidatus Methanofastidiosa archaeon]|nr:replication protein RepA [Candidatus Methanofastidiosa archaeon]HPR41165.1 replication protein RepA [Candidatus Methanofastidiosa archaeon]